MPRSRRLEFSSATRREAWERAGGICECHRVACLSRPEGCGLKLGILNGVYYEHISQAAIVDDNSLENCAVLVRTCWKEKTALHDIPAVAKSNRVRDKARGIR
jgi:5-methylcytosine-specific restriction enzyme A